MAQQVALRVDRQVEQQVNQQVALQVSRVRRSQFMIPACCNNYKIAIKTKQWLTCEFKNFLSLRKSSKAKSFHTFIYKGFVTYFFSGTDFSRICLVKGNFFIHLSATVEVLIRSKNGVFYEHRDEAP